MSSRLDIAENHPPRQRTGRLRYWRKCCGYGFRTFAQYAKWYRFGGLLELVDHGSITWTPRWLPTTTRSPTTRRRSVRQRCECCRRAVPPTRFRSAKPTRSSRLNAVLTVSERSASGRGHGFLGAKAQPASSRSVSIRPSVGGRRFRAATLETPMTNLADNSGHYGTGRSKHAAQLLPLPVGGQR